jgi:hypothetical protein
LQEQGGPHRWPASRMAATGQLRGGPGDKCLCPVRPDRPCNVPSVARRTWLWTAMRCCAELQPLPAVPEAEAGRDAGSACHRTSWTASARMDRKLRSLPGSTPRCRLPIGGELQMPPARPPLWERTRPVVRNSCGGNRLKAGCIDGTCSCFSYGPGGHIRQSCCHHPEVPEVEDCEPT